MPLDGFDGETWDKIDPSGANPFQSHAWLTSAAEAFGASPAQAIAVGPPSSPLAALAIRNVGILGGLRQLGSIDLGESVPILTRDEAALDLLLKTAAELRRPLCLGHYPVGDSDFVQRARRIFSRGLVVVRPRAERGLPYLDLGPDWQDPEAAIGRNRRQSLRRKWKKASAVGDVVFEMHAPAPSKLKPLLDEAIEVESQSWKGRTRTALAHDDRQRNFYRIYGARAAERGILRICFLRIGGRAAAMQIAVIANQRFWSIKIGYDETFSAFSPGELLMLEVIKRSVADGLTRIEFCGKEAAWTQRWTDRAHEIAAIRFYPANLSGAATLAGDMTRTGGNALLRKLKVGRSPRRVAAREDSESEAP